MDSGAVAEHDAAGFLQTPVRIHELRADQADAGVAIERVEQLVEPGRRDLGVVVQEHDVFAAREFGAGIARTDEAEVLHIAVRDDTIDLREVRRGLVG